jgi:hypothetical protein
LKGEATAELKDQSSVVGIDEVLDFIISKLNPPAQELLN